MRSYTKKLNELTSVKSLGLCFAVLTILSVGACAPVHKLASSEAKLGAEKDTGGQPGGGGQGEESGQTLEITCTTTGASEGIPLAPTFISICKNILGPKCVDCHGPVVAKRKVRFDTYASTLLQVIPGNHMMSEIYFQVSTGQMPRAPVPLLTSEEIDVIAEWIDNGALEKEAPLGAPDATKGDAPSDDKSQASPSRKLPPGQLTSP